MFKLSIKNFFKNLIYVFVPMGIFYLGLLLSIFFLISSFMKDINTAGSGILGVVSDSIVSSEVSIKDFFQYSMSQINWYGNFFDTLTEIMESNWIQNTIDGFLETLTISSEGLVENIESIVESFISAVIFQICFSIVFMLAIVYIANLVTRILLRKLLAKRTFKRKIIAIITKPLMNVISVVILFIIYTFINNFLVLFLLVLLILDVFISLLHSWFIYKDKSMKFKEIVNFKNIFSHILGMGIIVVILCFTIGIINLINSTLSILIAIPLVIYSYNIIEISTDSYVFNMINHSI